MALRRSSIPPRRGSSVRAALACVVLATLSAGIGYAFRREPPQRESPTAFVAEFDTVRVPVPDDVVPAGTRVKDIHFAYVRYPRHQMPDDVVTDVSSVGELTTSTIVPARLPLYTRNLSRGGSALNPVVERIPPGMRAMTVKVDATASVEGWAGSGSIVDVLLVESARTTVVAEKVKILSAERNVQPVAGQGAPSVPSTVTLLVTQEQCLAINTAIPLGRIAFALRSGRDEDSWGATSFTAERLKGAPSGASNERVGVTGVISIKEGNRQEAFALTAGKWIRTDTLPEGFFPAERRSPR